MSFSSWIRSLTSRLVPTGRANARRRRGRGPTHRLRPQLEPLEDRCLLSAGALDPTFGVGGEVLTHVGGFSFAGANATAIQSDGKIVVVGAAFNSSNEDLLVARYNSDGSLDTTFNGTGEVLNAFSYQFIYASSVAIQSDGKIVVVGQGETVTNGNSYTFDGLVLRYNSDGSPDTTFNGTGEVLTNDNSVSFFETGVAIQSDGRIVVADGRGILRRYNADGSPDATFDNTRVRRINNTLVRLGPGIFNELFGGVAVQSDGKIVEVGTTDSEMTVERFNSDGSGDATFNGNGQHFIDFGGLYSGSNGSHDLAIQSDGKIVVGGTDTTAVGPATVQSFAVARLNSDGSLDATFNGTGEVTTSFGNYNNDAAYAVALQPDGRIVVAGYTADASFTYQHFALAQYNPDGSLDTTFNGTGQVVTDVGGGFSAAVSMAIQSDDSIVATGYGANDGTTNSIALARYLDPLTFSTATLQQYVQYNNQQGGGATLLFQAGDSATPAEVIQTLNALTGVSQPVTIVLDLGGGTYSTDGVAYSPSDPATAQNVTFIIQNGTLDPSFPALTVSGGQVIVRDCALITTGDAPTVLVTGGSLTLRDDTIQETAGYGDPAIFITGGTLDLGTATSPGGNAIDIHSGGTFLSNTTGNPISKVGDVFRMLVTVNINSSLMLAGNNPPPLTGSVFGTPFTGSTTYTAPNGESVTITLGTTATSASPVGQYAITATLSGPNASDFVIDPFASTVGTLYVVSVGADPSGSGAQAVTFWDNKGNAKLITAADLSSLDALNLVNQGKAAFDPRSVAQLQAWLSVSPNATAAYQLAVQLAALDLNVLAGYVKTTDLVYAGALLPYATADNIAGLTSGGFIDVQDLMNAANAVLSQVSPGAPSGDPNAAYETALTQVFQAVNGNTDFVSQEVLWNLLGF
jgi:uncharacterized delta-60 repeat protein